MTARDLFPDTPRDEKPAAEVQAQHRQGTGRTPGRDGQERLAHLGADARVCGNCGNAGRPGVGGFLPCAVQPKWNSFAPTWSCDSWVEITPDTQAKRDAQSGIDQAVEAADRQHAGWSDTAYAFIELFCVQNKSRRCIGHDIVQASIAQGVIQPSNAKAWGGPIQRAARARLIKRVGFDEDPNRHGNPVPLWEVA